MIRPLLLAAALASLGFAAAPAGAAEADVALLMKYAGNWQGKGKLEGAEEGNLECRLTMKPSGEKLRYSGRCAVDGQGSRSFQGTIVFNNETRQFEMSTSNAPTVVGEKKSGGLIFQFQDDDTRGSMSSMMTFTSDAIRFAFQAMDAKTREVTRASIPFKKS